MPKDLTTKDILYALEFLHDALVRTPPRSLGGKPSWQMKATGAPVKEAIANEVRNSGAVVAVPDHGGRELIVWRSAA